MPLSTTPKLPTIGILDSGVGGLSVFNEIKKNLPCANYLYYCDNANFPYGTKSAEQVINIVTAACEKMLNHSPLDLLVIACNTASTLSLEAMRKKFSIPFVGVVPAIKPAARSSLTKVIGVLATRATSQGAYVDALIKDFASDCEVIKQCSFRLVELAEEKLAGKTINSQEIKSELAPLFNVAKLDTIVLGCTHFPLLLAELEDAAPRPIHWLSSGPAIAARVVQLVHISAEVDVGTCKSLFSNFKGVAPTLKNYFTALGFTSLLQS